MVKKKNLRRFQGSIKNRPKASDSLTIKIWPLNAFASNKLNRFKKSRVSWLCRLSMGLRSMLLTQSCKVSMNV